MSTEGLAKRARDTREKVDDSIHDTEEKRRPNVAAAAKLQGLKGIQSLLIAVAFPFAAGSVVGLLNGPDAWYASLKKPSWNPPNWVFGVVWSLLYPLMGLASWLVWAKGGWQKHMYPLALYLLQLGLNLLWSILFFSLHSPKLALVDICTLEVVLILCIRAFKPVNHVASYIMIPYFAWVLLATALNVSILRQNFGLPLGKPEATKF